MPEQPFDATILLPSEHTKGAVGAVALDVPASWSGPPLHHHAFDEAFYVLAGRLAFQLQIRAVVVTRRAGQLALAPRGVHHTWANHSDAPARTLIVCTPAGFEPYFGEMAARQAGLEPPAWARRPVPPTTVVGPQIPRDTAAR